MDWAWQKCDISPLQHTYMHTNIHTNYIICEKCIEKAMNVNTSHYNFYANVKENNNIIHVYSSIQALIRTTSVLQDDSHMYQEAYIIFSKKGIVRHGTS